MQISTIRASLSLTNTALSLRLDLSICLIVPGVHSQISLSIFVPCRTVGPSFISLSPFLSLWLTLLTMSKPKYLHCPFFSLDFFWHVSKPKYLHCPFFSFGFFLVWVDNFTGSMGFNYSCKYLLFEKIGFVFSLSCFSFSHKRCSFSLHLDLYICLIVPWVHSQISFYLCSLSHCWSQLHLSLLFSLCDNDTADIVKAKISPLSLFFPLDFFWHASKPKYLHCPFFFLWIFFGMGW